MTLEEKKRLEMDMNSVCSLRQITMLIVDSLVQGRFSGYKPPNFKICADGFPDTWEEFNAWSDAFENPEERMPKCLRDELDRVEAYLRVRSRID